MTYHLPRVMHWIQNGSIYFFPTEIGRQNYLAPFAEWNLLNFQILAQTDRLLNLVQWFAYLGTCVAVSLIARLLGAGKRGQWMAVIFAATTPMAILQSTSTQNDLVASFFVVCFIYFGLLMSEQSRTHGERLSDAAFCGVALGLGIATKATVYVIAAPFVVLIAWRALRICRWRAIIYGSIITVAVVVIPLGHSLRSFALYGNFMGPSGEPMGRSASALGVFEYKNARMDPPRFAYCFVRNVALHGNIEGLPKFRKQLKTKVKSLAHWLNLAENDPETTWAGMAFHIAASRSEDGAGNFVQVALFLIVSTGLLFHRATIRLVPAYCFCIVGGACFFALVLRWQPWGARLHLPLFMAMAPVCGAAMETWKSRGVAAFLSGVSLVYAVPFVVANQSRPLFGNPCVFHSAREQQYFVHNLDLLPEYQNAIATLKRNRCQKVGLQTDTNDFEYPFWPLTRHAQLGEIEFFQVNVTSVSKSLADRIAPDAVIATYPITENEITVATTLYRRELQTGHLSVFLKK